MADIIEIIETPKEVIEVVGGAASQVNSDWSATTGVAQILNKPTIPAAQVNSDWSATTGVAQILNKPTIPAAASTAPVALGTAAVGTSAAYARADHVHPLPAIPAAQVNSDWSATTGVAQILNKPTIPAAQVNSDWSATTGVAQILNKPTIPAAQVNSDWSATTGVAQILNKPTIPAAATATPAALGTAAVGTSDAYARADHVHQLPVIPASAITSGVLDNARVNFASPSAIGAQNPNTGVFTNLWASSRLNLPSSGSNANDIWVSSGQVRYQAGSQVTSARTLLSAEDNLSNLANTATARTNLGLGSAATAALTDFAAASHNHADATTTVAGFLSASDKTKLDSVASGAEVNVNADWNATSGDAWILNKPATFPPSSHTHLSADITGLGDWATLSDGAGLRTENLIISDGESLDYIQFTAGSGVIFNGNRAEQFREGLGLGTGDVVRFGSIQNTPIGSTTRNTGAFTTLSANNGVLLASAPVLNLSQTWNNAAVAFTGFQQTITNTASAVGSRLFNFVVGSTSAFSARTMLGPSPTEALAIGGGDRGLVFGNNTFTNPNAGFFTLRWQANLAGFNSSAILAWGADVYNLSYDLAVQRDAADTLAQRRTTNPQVFRIYNTYTDGSNYERAKIAWSSNVLQIGTEKLGTGSARALEFQTDGSTRLTITTGGSVLHAISDGVLGWSTSTLLRPISGNGTLRLSNAAQTDFSLLQFGGTTSLFPALKRSSTTLQVRLADDTADAPLSSASLTSGDGTRTSLAYLFASDTDTGFYRRGTDTITFVTGGSNRFEVSGSQVRLEVNQLFGWTFNDLSGSLDLVLRRDAADTLAQRRDGNAQTFRIYNTSTSSNANFERANFRWASNEFIIDAEAGGTGTSLRGIKIGSATSSLLGFYGATPVTQRAAIADATDAATTQARLNDLLAAMRSLGLIAT